MGGWLGGIYPDSSFEEGHETLRTGDILVVYTDGITEAMDAQEEIFGEERLVALVRDNRHLTAEALVQHIYQAVRDFAQGMEQHDDITLLILKVG